MDKEEIIPLHIEDEYVRNYLWERALIAIDDPCTKSHPHENMNEYCQHKTKDEPVAWGMKKDGVILDVICPAEHEREEGEYTIPLYTHPKEWVGLTIDEISELVCNLSDPENRIELGQKIEFKLKEKNDGN